MDINDPTMQEMTQIGEQYGLNQYIIRDCLEPDHLPKYDIIDEVNFLILRFFSHSFDKRIATIQDLTNKIAIFYNPDFLITIHKTEVPVLETIRKKYVSPGKCSSTAEVVIKIIWSCLDTFVDPAQRLSEQIDFHEKNIMIRKTNIDQLEALYYIKRQASISHKIIMLMQEPINHIHSVPRDDAALQDVHDQHLKVKTLYNQVFDDVNNLMNLYMSFSAQKTNEVMKVLTIFSVFFMPLTFIVGIYGMNFQFMPELKMKWGYPGALVLMILITVTVYFWFKKKKWL
jgi:magnesium transporter